MNMPLNFGTKVEEKSNDVIPKDAILWCVMNVREVKLSRETNGQYLDIELTVADNQPYARRKLWDKIPNPFDTNNSEEWRNMGYGTIRRILEAVKGATPDNPNSYALNALTDLHGLTVPVLIGIEKGSAQYPDDKNRAEYLSPHSSVKKVVEAYRLLASGVHQYGKPAPAAAPQQGSMFAGTQAPPPAAMPAQQQAPQQAAGPGWLAPQPAAPQAGFQQPAPLPQGQPAHAVAVPQQAPMTNMAPPATPATASPSNQPWNVPGGAPAQFPGSNTGQ